MNERVYLDRGTVAHFLIAGASANGTSSESLCGLSSWPTLWRGTGNPGERERAVELRPCTKCAVALTEEAARRHRLAASMGLLGGDDQTPDQQSEVRGVG